MGLANMDVCIGNGCSCLSDALSLVRLVETWGQNLYAAPQLSQGFDPMIFG